MIESSAPTMAELKQEEEMLRPRPNRGLVIALPIQRADLPALSLMLLALALLCCWFWLTNQPGSLLAGTDPTVATWDPLIISLLHQKPITLTLTGTATTLFSAYNGVWNG